MKPKLRTDAYYDLQAIIVNGLEQSAKENMIYTSCINCVNFNEQMEICKIANQRPPARVIVFGCPKWEENDIPF